MDIEKEDAAIDEQFALFVQPNSKLDNIQHFKSLADVYLSKHNIPYSRESSGSCIKYRCPFSVDCGFCIKGGICRSKSPGKKGILSLNKVCLEHTCGWEHVPRNKRITNYRPSYQNRRLKTYSVLFLASVSQMKNVENDTNEGPTSGQSVFPIDVGGMFSLNPGENFESKNTAAPSKRSGSSLEWMRSKRPMYCRNAYMHYLVKHLVKRNPYISLQSIIDVLEEKHVEYKTISVAKARSDERNLYITSMKDIIPKLHIIKNVIMEVNKSDNMEIITTNVGEKELLSAVFVCPYISREIHCVRSQPLCLDCSYLKGDVSGVLFHASEMDPGHQPLLLAYMIAEEENVMNWRRFIELLERCNLVNQKDECVQVLLSLCLMLESNLPQLECMFSDLSLGYSPWYVNGNVRRKKSIRVDNNNSLRSLFFRCVFSLGDKSDIFMTRLVNEKNELVDELRHLGKWNRSCFQSRPSIIHSLCLNHVEHDLLENQSLQYLMIDDLLMGLYYFQCVDCEERRQIYSRYDPQELTPYFQHIITDYARYKEEYIIDGRNPNAVICTLDTVQHRFIVDLSEKTCSCGMWQEMKFPCLHSWLIMKHQGLSIKNVDYDEHTIRTALLTCPETHIPHFPHHVLTQIAYYQRSVQRSQREEVPEMLAQPTILPLNVDDVILNEEKNLVSL